MSFIIISLTVLIITFVWFFIATKSAGYGFVAILRWWRQNTNSAWREGAHQGWFSHQSLRKLSYFLALDLTLILALTALIQPWFLQKNMSGLLLLLHMTAAPFFALAIATFTIYSARAFAATTGGKLHSSSIRRVYWLGLIIALLVITSSVAAMFPVARYAAQITLAAVHKYAALILLIIFFVQSYLVVVLKFNSATAPPEGPAK